MATNLLQKSAHVAVGLPISAARAVLDRVKDLRGDIAASGDRISADLKTRFDSWVEEGEHLMSSIAQARDEGYDKVADLRARGQATMDKTAETTRDAVDTAVGTAKAGAKALTDPMVSVTEISGIGPATAEKLSSAGITTVSGLLERTGTEKDLELLSKQVDISTGQLADWRRQADLTRITGVGEEMQTLLQAAGTATLEAVAAIKPSELDKRMQTLSEMGFDQIPSMDTLRSWIAQAKKLSS